MGISESIRDRIKSKLHPLFSAFGLSLLKDLTQSRQETEAEFEALRAELPLMRAHYTALNTALIDQLRAELNQQTQLVAHQNSVIERLRAEMAINRFVLQREAQSMGAVLRADIRRLSSTSCSLADTTKALPSQRLPRICFVLPYTYSLFNPATSYIFGGSEVRAWLLGKALARIGDLEVFFAVNDHGQAPLERRDNVSLYRATSLLSKVQPPPGHIWPEGHPIESLQIDDDLICEENLSYITNVDADLYIVFGVHNQAAEIATICRRDQKRMVIFAGSDDNFSSRLLPGSTSTDNYGNNAGYAYQALMLADWIITQTERQAVLLKERFDRTAQVLRNPIDLNDSRLAGPRTSPPTPACLWIGKSDRVKRPDLLIELARQLPEFQFTMVMNRSNEEIHATIVNEAPPNVQIIEKVPISQIEGLFQQASFLINTSIFEGFPNTFLQAGKYGVPVVSLNVDPDDFIQRHNCGLVAQGEVKKVTDGLRTILSDVTHYQLCSANIHHYVRTYHNLTELAISFNQMILESLHHLGSTN